MGMMGLNQYSVQWSRYSPVWGKVLLGRLSSSSEGLFRAPERDSRRQCFCSKSTFVMGDYLGHYASAQVSIELYPVVLGDAI